MHHFCFKKQLHCICLTRSHSFFLPFGATALETSRPRRIAARTAPEPACQHAPCRELLPPSCWSRLPSLLSKSHPAHCFQPRRELCCRRNHRMPGAPLSAIQAAAPRRSRPQAAHYHALGSAPPRKPRRGKLATASRATKATAPITPLGIGAPPRNLLATFWHVTAALLGTGVHRVGPGPLTSCARVSVLLCLNLW